MAGIIREARDIYKGMEKKKKEYMKRLDVIRDQCGKEPDMPSVQEFMEGELNTKCEEFRQICEIAVRLRDIAIDTGLVCNKDGGDNNDNPRLEGKYAMITIRPEEGAFTLEEFHLYLLTYLKKSYFLGGVYTFEQLGEDVLTIGKGWHVHIVCKLKPYVQFQELERDVEKCIPGYVSPKKLKENPGLKTKYLFQVGESGDNKKRPRKFLNTHRDLEYCLNYLDGEKHDVEKALAVARNEDWRLAMDLEQRYTWGENIDFRERALPESSTRVGECLIEEVN